MITAIVPVKALCDAKRRLTGVLAPAVRERLVLTMLADVLAVLAAAPSVGRVLVVTPDPKVARLAREAGATPLVERNATDLNAAIREGIAVAARGGASAALVVPADVPLVSMAEIEALAAAACTRTAPFALLVPDLGRGGTNALLLSPPAVLDPHFGAESLSRHASEAERRGIVHAIMPLDGLAFDIDEPGDLVSLIQPGPAAARYAFLKPQPVSARTSETREEAAPCMSGVSNA